MSLKLLLSNLSALYKLFQFFHWQSKGEDFYEHHLLYERLYNETQALLDGVAEKSIGVFGDDLDMVEDAQQTSKLLEKWKSQSELKAVEEVNDYVSKLAEDLRKDEKMTEGLENLLQGISDKLESFLYLLKSQEKTANRRDNMITTAAVPQVFYELLDKDIEKILKLFNEFEANKEGKNLTTADYLADYLYKLIPDTASSLRKAVNRDLSENPEKETEEVGLKLKLLKSKLKTVNDYIMDRRFGGLGEEEKEIKAVPPTIIKRKHLEANMISKLFKLAYHLDTKGFYSEADQIDKMIETLARRVGINLDELVATANYLDSEGLVEAADKIDELINKMAKGKYKTWKGKDEKPPRGAEKKAPKKWFDKMKKEIKAKNPSYSAKRVDEIVGDIWDRQLSHAKRQSIFKEYGKSGDPDKPSKK